MLVYINKIIGYTVYVKYFILAQYTGIDFTLKREHETQNYLSFGRLFVSDCIEREKVAK